MTRTDYEVYFRRPDDAVVWAPIAGHNEISLVHHNHDDSWHCALCNSTDCQHARAARSAKETEAA